jgi:SAM-dependent methyltransferase
MALDPLLAAVERYYSDKVTEHGPSPQGVDWKDDASQRLRFAQLLKICPDRGPFSLNDYGCGYGALVHYLDEAGYRFSYRGFDISRPMLEHARTAHGADDRVDLVGNEDDLAPADFTVTSGIFNVKLETDAARWTEYVLSTIARLDALSLRGFSFNMLTAYADRDRMRPDLYYGDPGFFFDHCKRTYSRHVALLHDYGLFEFTILVRREPLA